MDYLLQIVLSNTAIAILPAIAAVATRRMSSRPALQHALWLLVILKLLTPPVFTVPMPLLPAGAQPAPAKPAVVVAGATAGKTQSGALGRRDVSRWSAPSHAAVSEPSEATVASGSAAPAAIMPHPSARPTHSRFALDWRAAIVAIWVGGSLLCAWIIARRLLRFRRLLRYAEPAGRMVQFQADAAARRIGLRGSPGVWFVPGAVCPMLIAIGWRARLLIPRVLWVRLDHRQRGTLLLHELAHLRRHDHWVRVLEIIACVTYWWHPLAWLARREIRRAEEQCCDAWVLASDRDFAADYAEALLHAVDVSCGVRVLPALASGMGDFRDLKRRLMLIQNGGGRKALGWPAFAGACLLAASLLPVAPLLARARGRAAAISPGVDDQVVHAAGSLTANGLESLLDSAQATRAQLDQARSHLQEIERALGAAQRRLEHLQATTIGSDVQSDRERRLDLLERRLTDMLEEIRAMKSTAGSDGATGVTE